MELHLKKVHLTAGDQLILKGVVPPNANRFQIDLGSSNDDLALHFNPRFEDGHGGAVLVFNSKSGGSWGSEKRELHSQIKRGEEVKIMVKFAGDMFKVELPGGQEVKFPNHAGASFMSYISVSGDLKLTSFKICQ